MSTSYTITGVVAKVCDSETFAKGFVKRSLWLETERESNYPQTVNIEFVKDKGDLLNGLVEGQAVTVEVNIRGNIWKDRCFVSLQGWKLEAEPMKANEPAPVDNSLSNDDLMDDGFVPPF